MFPRAQYDTLGASHDRGNRAVRYKRAPIASFGPSTIQRGGRHGRGNDWRERGAQSAHGHQVLYVAAAFLLYFLRWAVFDARF
jgi:hypothetical protein